MPQNDQQTGQTSLPPSVRVLFSFKISNRGGNSSQIEVSHITADKLREVTCYEKGTFEP